MTLEQCWALGLHDWLDKGERAGFAHDRMLLRAVRERYPWPCSGPYIFEREADCGTCWQLAEPLIWHKGCPSDRERGLHSDGYSADGDGLCEWCGARPGWPLHDCREPSARGYYLALGPDDGTRYGVPVEKWFPYLCTGWEVSATATYDGQATLGLCWVKP